MNMYNKKFLILILVATIAVSFVFYFYTKPDTYDKNELYENKIAGHTQSASNQQKYGVASNNTIATRIGNKILKDGGNAADATMGVGYALAVTEPHSSGLGGGGVMLTYNGDQNAEPKQYQYKDISSYNFKQKDVIGTPGFVKGMHEAHQREGKMSEKDILNYVIPLATDGFEVDSELERSLKLYGSDVDRDSPFFDGSRTKREGDVVKQPALAKTLKGIRDNGPDYFYDKVGKSISKQLDNKLTKKDFQDYEMTPKAPVSTDYLNNKIYSASNPLSGTLMLQGLEIDEAMNNSVPMNRTDYLEGVIKSRNLMYQNRDIVNGQDNNSENYLSQEYILSQLNEVNQTQEEINPEGIDNTHTTHFVVVDKDGNLTSTTNTLDSYFGSGKYMKEGFYMNNALKNFSSDPNSPNYGEKHKQPRSFAAPTIVVGPNFYMGIGTPGGNKIPTMLNEVIVDYIRNDSTLQDALDKPRFYNDGGTVYYEKAMPNSDIDVFKNMGYNVEEKRNDPNFGSVQAAVYNEDDDTVEVGQDVGNR